MSLAASFGTPLYRLAAAAATLVPQFPRILLLKSSLLSTSPAGNDTPTGCPEAENTCSISEFLLNECRLCQSEVSTILKRRPSLVRMRSTHTPQQAVRFLRDSGLTESQVRKIITRRPSILTTSAERHLKPKIGLMKTLGLRAQDFRNAITKEPRLLNCSLEKTLCPNILYLQNLFGPEADISKVFKWAPWILINSNGPEIFENNLKRLASFGLLEDETKELARRSPLILTVSMDKVQKIMDFFIHTAGLPAKFLLSYPLVLTYSLECRIKPRSNVLKYISAMQPSKRLPGVTSALYLGERKFLEKYVECNPQATKLLEIYRGKPADLDIIQ
jgi:mTERF domain-containing protein